MPVKGDASSRTTSAIAEGTIDIRENPTQDISALNRDTANSLNELGKIFDKAKIEEQQELAAVFGEEAFRLAHNLKDDGSGRKIAIHFAIGGIMSAITGAGFASGAIGAGLNEALINNLKGLDPGTAQIVSGIIGVAAAKVAGGNAMAGAAAAASGTKNNLTLEDLEVKVPWFREVHKRIEERKDDVAAQAMNEALYLVNSGSLVLEKMDADYMTIQLSVGEGIKVASTACTIDKYGNVYATIAFAPGASIGVPINTGLGWWPSLRNELKRKIENGEIEQSDLSAIARYYRDNVPGWGGSITAIGGIGGAIGLSTSGIISSEILASVSVGLSLTIGLTYYVGTIGG